MSNDQFRAEFEKAFPLPAGISWDGDHFSADRTVIGSHSNATIWGHMWRGWRRSRETLCIELPQDSRYAGDFDAMTYRVDDVISAIEAAGIRTC